MQCDATVVSRNVSSDVTPWDLDGFDGGLCFDGGPGLMEWVNRKFYVRPGGLVSYRRLQN